MSDFGSLRVVALAGGVGGAKLADGLAQHVAGDRLSVIVNTADDFWHHGLRVCPDLDTVMYTLAGLANPATGWGIAGDTTATLDALTRLGQDPWFLVGDQDFATHILRTEWLRQGQSLTAVTAKLASALGIPARILPMTDDPVATKVRTSEGLLDFQDYFVARRQQDDVLGVEFADIDDAHVAPAALNALRQADVIVICPSNPIVSIGPILALPKIRESLKTSTAPIVAVSPIVGGKALKGPADRMLATLGYEVSAASVATILAGVARVLVIDRVDEALAPRIEETGMRALVTDTVMRDRRDREQLAETVLAAAVRARR
jgi:LPPG:FO 2-phospho-L-lactate transferase